MDPLDRTAVVAALEANLRHLERVVARVDEQRATQRPAPDRWSPLETLEHLVVVERAFTRPSPLRAAGSRPTCGPARWTR